MKAALHESLERELLLSFFGDIDRGVYIDVGGNVPESSVTLPFHDLEWTGLVVEPIPGNAQKLRDAGRTVWEGALSSPKRAEAGTAKLYIAGGAHGAHSSLSEQNLQSGLEGEITVPLSTVDALCMQFGIDHVDLLSIDTEGTELDILQGTDLSSLNVRLVLVEDWVLDRRLHRYLCDNGYKLVRRTGYNSWYVPSGMAFPVTAFGRWQLFRKYYLSVPLRRFKRRSRQAGS